MNTQEKTGDNPLGWGDCPGVERNPRRVHGAWTLEDTRLPLHVIFENLAAGATIQEVTQWFEGRQRGAGQGRSGPRRSHAGKGQDLRGNAAVKILLAHNAPQGLRYEQNLDRYDVTFLTIMSGDWIRHGQKDRGHGHGGSVKLHSVG